MRYRLGQIFDEKTVFLVTCDEIFPSEFVHVPQLRTHGVDRHAISSSRVYEFLRGVIKSWRARCRGGGRSLGEIAADTGVQHVERHDLGLVAIAGHFRDQL